MTLANLIREVEKYVHIQGPANVDRIKGFINQCILEFARLDEWEKLKTAEVITLDGSDSYDLTAVLVDPFFSELALVTEDNEEWLKLGYIWYLQAPDKAKYYAVHGTTLYVTGTDLDINFLYKTLGEDYPLTDDSDEVPATIYYWDIIKMMTVIKVMDYLGDEQVKVEKNNLDIVIGSAKNAENRTRKKGKPKFVSRL